ncbi:MAG: hypothetical protein ACLRP3_13365 [Escherichia sp.]
MRNLNSGRNMGMGDIGYSQDGVIVMLTMKLNRDNNGQILGFRPRLVLATQGNLAH